MARLFLLAIVLGAFASSAVADFVLQDNEQAIPLYEDPSRDLLDDILDDEEYFAKFEDAAHARAVVNKWETQNMTLEETIGFFDDMDESDLPLLSPMNAKQAMKLRRSLERGFGGGSGCDFSMGRSWRCKEDLGDNDIHICLCVKSSACNAGTHGNNNGNQWNLDCSGISGCTYKGRDSSPLCN